MAAAVPVPTVQWPDSAAGVKARLDCIMKDTVAAWDQVAAVPDHAMTYDNVVGRLSGISTYKTNPLVCEAKFLQHCSPDTAIRAASNKAGAVLKLLRRRGRMREDVYNKVRQYKDTTREALTHTQRHFLDSVLHDFRTSGLHLSREDRQRLEMLQREEAQLCQAYNSNVSEETSTLTFRRDELAGVNPAFVESHTDAATGLVHASMKHPDAAALLTQCHVEATRERVAAAREATGCGNNVELLVRIVNVRHSIAHLLGYENYATYMCDGSMVGGPEQALRFLGELEEKLRVSAKREFAKLAELKGTLRGGETTAAVEAWDIPYLTSKLAEAECGLNHDTISTYLPLDHVVDATLHLFEDIFGVAFVEVPAGAFNTWHDTVRLFSVHDRATHRHMGHVYLDLLPRHGKHPHSGVFYLCKRYKDINPVAVVLTNLSSEQSGDPPVKCLRHKDLVTLFHELGHAMHGICAEGDANMTRLAKCPRDFMEAPSQMMENLAWDKNVLRKVSKNVYTGKQLPPSLAEKIQASRFVNASVETLNHIFLSYIDIKLHTDPPATVAEAEAMVADARLRVMGLRNPPGWNVLRNFCHTVNHYPSAYYSYLWSEVVSADMFYSRFAAGGAAKARAGREYRNYVLAPGGIGCANERVAKFLGRPSNANNFLRSRGIMRG